MCVPPERRSPLAGGRVKQGRPSPVAPPASRRERQEGRGECKREGTPHHLLQRSTVPSGRGYQPSTLGRRSCLFQGGRESPRGTPPTPPLREAVPSGRGHRPSRSDRRSCLSPGRSGLEKEGRQQGDGRERPHTPAPHTTNDRPRIRKERSTREIAAIPPRVEVPL